MIYIIENNLLKVEISSKGAELQSIYNKKNDIEYLWQGNPTYWGRRSPILFPNVGKLYNGVFKYNGQVFNQGQHGFARDMEFTLVGQKENGIEFSLIANEETLMKYPFMFELILSYELIDNKIKCGYEVKNLDTKTMYFQIGGHPGFNVPLGNDKRSDYYFYFKNKNEIISSTVTEKGFASDLKTVYPLVNGYLNISDDLFINDALVIENQDIKELSICDKNKKPILKFNFDAQIFGLWSPDEKAPFVCFEPWYGRCDRDGYDGDISNREYINKLLENEKFERSYSIEVI